MKKRHFKSVMLALCMLVSFYANAHGFEVDGIYYNILTTTEVEVTFKGSYYSEFSEYKGKVEIPESISYYGSTYSVTSIGYDAFYDCTGLTSITIPNSVTRIGGSAFYGCTGLTSITIPNSVTRIGGSAFYGCTGLTSITIPNSVTSISSLAFKRCTGLASITVDAGNAVYDSRENCNAIIEKETNSLIFGCKNTVIPNSVTSIGHDAFGDCTGLTSITIPNSVTSIGNYAFRGCTGLTSVTIPNSVTSIGYDAFYGCTGLTSITIPNSVTSIGNYAFRGCTGLTSVTIPNSVTSIGNYAFRGCTGLTSVTIPNSVTSIGYDAFYGCTGLTSITVDNGNAVYDSRENCNAIIEKETNSLISGCKNTTIPNSVTSIGDCAFSGCTGLTSINIPNSVTSIGYEAFYGCTGLTSITIPNSVTSITYRAFEGCTGLTSITIPNSVTSIGTWAFHGCTGLASITVDDGNAVYDSREKCNAIIEKETNSLISGCKNTTIPNSVTSIGGGAFSGCTGLTSINIPNSVTSIGDDAFSGCTGLTSITIPNSVTSIGRGAFSGCTGLASITIPNSVTSSIGDWAFSGCTGLTSITIPNSVTSIDYLAFDGCTGLTSITIPNSVTSIGCSAFEGCNSLSEIYSYMENPCDCPSFGSSPTLYVPAGTADKYIEQGWDNWASEIVEVEMSISSTLSVSDVKVTHGASVILPVSMENEESVTAFQFEVSLPEGVSLVGCELTDRKSDQMLSFSELPNGNYQVAALSLTSKAFKDSEGALVNLQLATEKEMEAGEYNVTVKNIELTTTDEDALRPADCTAKLTVTDVMVGDSNGDGKISITDAVAIVNYILSKPSSSFAVEAADVNMDAKVTITDAVAIVNKILAGTTEAKSRAADMQLDPQ